MKKEIYCQAMKNIKMSDECLGEILDNIDEMPEEATGKKVHHIKLVPLLAAAAVLVFGSVGVAAEAGVFDWMKNFFHDEEIPAFYIENAGKMNNFVCESEFGIEISPVGTIGEGKEICCVFEIEKLPEDMKFESLHIGIADETFNRYHEAHPDINGVYGGASYVHLNDENENLIGILARSDADMFATGTEITFDVWPTFENSLERVAFKEKYGFEEDEMCDIAKLSFTLETKKTKEKVIDYSTYTCSDIPERDYDFLFDKIYITPLTINSTGSRSFYADEMLSSSDLIVVFEDGTELNLGINDTQGVSYSGQVHAWPTDNNTTIEERAKTYGEPNVTTSWKFDKPIDPDTITEIYLGDMRIYNAAEE
ncbi:MAG: hypothetical protein IJX24_05675 [Oscillospiraceae bacterium]|nr:hypothetical protein [Oscillospiraceae bacterium]